MSLMSIRTISPCSRLNGEGGTRQVPVDKITPSGWISECRRQLDQLVVGPVQLGGARRAAPDRLPAAGDGEPDRQRVGVSDLPGGPDGRAEGAAAEKYLRLRQVERVLAFDGAGGDIVADCVAGDLAEGVDDERDLGLGHVKGRVAADGDGLAVPDNSPGGRLVKQLRARRVVDPLVDVRRLLAFLYPCLLRDLVRHAAGPDLGPAVDRRQQHDLGERELAVTVDRSRVAP